MALAKSLSKQGLEVLAIDQSEERIRYASEFVALARCFDATDEREVASTAPDRRDISVCAMGSESREGSIICTALLRQLGAPRIVARATDPVHERILLLVGAHEVVNPEQELGARMAMRLLYTGIVDEVPIGDQLVLTELMVPTALAGRNLVELQLPKRHQLNVVAIRRKAQNSVSAPSPTDPLQLGDLLIVVSAPGTVARLVERWQ
jgi:trk system potassium uptake protein TrkA